MSNYKVRSCLFDSLFAEFLSMFQLRIICWHIDVANNDLVFSICKLDNDNDYVVARINYTYTSGSYSTFYFDFADFFCGIVEHYHLDWKPWVGFLQKNKLV